MKMTVLEMSYKNIRRINELTLSFSEAKNTFLMMGNGTGKTTTMDLIKGLLDGTAAKWSTEKVKEYRPISGDANSGEFSIRVKFDDSQYIYKLLLNYSDGIAKIKTTALPKGEENGLKLPESLKGIFSPEFVRRFVFDGEQAVKSLDSSSNEAEETIKYLYRLDELDEILAANEKILTEIQNAEGKPGTDSSLKNLRSRQKSVKETIKRLRSRQQELTVHIGKLNLELDELVAERNELDAKNKSLNDEKAEIEKDKIENRGKIDGKIKEILNAIKSPYNISSLICQRMKELGMNMTKLKLPKASSKDFFVELANTSECICGRHIGEAERENILMNAEKYLGSDQQAVLNEIKNTLNACEFDNHLEELYNNLSSLLEEENHIQTRETTNRERLLKAGGDKAQEIQGRIDELNEQIGSAKKELNIIESKDTDDESLTEDNNLPKAIAAEAEYDKKIASATKTNQALQRKTIIDSLVKEIKEKATIDLKSAIIKKTNERLKKVITDDNIEVEDINKYIKLKGKAGASEGQTLSIAYCFLGTLFEDSELEFPFIIDSPAGKMDFNKRKAVADIIPHIFNQLIAFVTSAEVEQFADRFYTSADTQYITIIASPDGVSVHKGQEFFDSYQREHKEEE